MPAANDSGGGSAARCGYCLALAVAQMQWAFFTHTFRKRKVALIGVEAGGEGAGGLHAAPLCHGRPGVLHGSYSYLLQDGDGQVLATESISAGLDYPGVGPEHSHLKESGRARYVSETNGAALVAFDELCRLEGIIPALESSHALAFQKSGKRIGCGKIILVNLSGRGDKDLRSVLQAKGMAANKHRVFYGSAI